MTDEEVARVVPAPTCSFRFSEGQQTQVAINADGKGVMKIAGQLVPLDRVVASGGLAGLVPHIQRLAGR